MLRFLEHVCLAALSGGLLGRWLLTRVRRRALRRDVSCYLRAVRHLEGASGQADVLEWKDVTEAPPATMDVSNLAPGEAASYTDTRGSIYRFKIDENTLVNIYHTKAGVRRSGDIHECTQYDVVLKGRTRLRILDPVTGREIVRDYKENDFIVIPARTPHMFEFLEDNCLLEWWSADFKAWYYKPYRTVIDQALPLATTEHVDFSINISDQLGPARLHSRQH